MWVTTIDETTPNQNIVRFRVAHATNMMVSGANQDNHQKIFIVPSCIVT